MKFLVLQHHPAEDPGTLCEFFAADGITYDAVELDAGEAIPSLDGYDALIAMGGPMDVWQEDAHPWLKTEKAVIREAVQERDMPYLGVCLGHQLLADALGGKVGPMETSEIGVLDVDVLPAGEPVLGGGTLKALQWHSAEVTEIPPGGEVLACSPISPCQALRVGPKAIGIQYHVEVTSETVDSWAVIPEYKDALERTLGDDAIPAFRSAVNENMESFRARAKQLYDAFMVGLK